MPYYAKNDAKALTIIDLLYCLPLFTKYVELSYQIAYRQLRTC